MFIQSITIQKRRLLLLVTACVLFFMSTSAFSGIDNGSLSASATTNNTTAVSFSFIDTEGNIHDLQQYSGKPIILEWAASWCVTCEDTQKAMLQLYPSYKDSVTFISLSYGGSGDNLNDVKEMKNRGPYPWIFGLDHEDYAATVQIPPGSLWILDKDLSLVKEWRAQIVSARQIQEVVNSLLPENEREPLVTQSNNGPVQTPFYQNPLFIGFGLFVLIIAGATIILHSKKTTISSTNATTLTQRQMRRTEDALQSLMESLPAASDKTRNTSLSKKRSPLKPRVMKSQNVKK